MTLDDAIATLYAREINCGCETFWERLSLSAAIDHFRNRNFEQASVSAQRIFHKHQRPPFTGQFTEENNLADLRAEYEELARKPPG